MDAINQKLIASHLNISRTTVSRCFRNHKRINPKTRARVFALAARLGYQYLQPTLAAKRDSEAASIGVLICEDIENWNPADFEHPGSEYLSGIAEYAQLHRCQTHVHFVSPRAATLANPTYTTLRGLEERLWSGLLLIRRFPEPVAAELSSRFPSVSFVEPYEGEPIDRVDVNDYQGIAHLVEHLRRLGHIRIGFFCHRAPVGEVWARRRLSAYLGTLLQTGLPIDRADVIYLDTTSLETVRAGYGLAAEQTRAGVTAWMCATDRHAYDLINALEERGLAVPAKVSVTGFEGNVRPPGKPTLDALRIPYHEIGFAGSQRLFDKIQQRSESSREILLDCSLREGETAGPCRARLS